MVDYSKWDRWAAEFSDSSEDAAFDAETNRDVIARQHINTSGRAGGAAVARCVAVPVFVDGRWVSAG